MFSYSSIKEIQRGIFIHFLATEQQPTGCQRLLCLGVEIAAHCDNLFKFRLSKFSYLLTYLLTKATAHQN